MTTNDKEKSEVLNKFFSSVFVNEGDGPVPDFKSDYENELSNIEINEDQMYNVLKKLNSTKSPGPDKIHPRVIKELAKELSYPLHLFFNKSIKDGILPDSWKEAVVTPIFKKGSKEQPGNYRPVSLTSIICKIFESFIRDALYDHLVSNSLLSNNQFGFCRGRSCVSQLLVTINDWFQSLDKKIPVDAAYLDFRKAFDSVPHKRLLTKLHGYGIRGNILKWIESFLSNRTQFVNVNNQVSDHIDVTSGVPQGSVLGPCLFIYYINDLPDAVNCLIQIFADDTKAYLPILTCHDNMNLQSSLDQMVKWSNKWLISFNAEKCKVLYLGKNNKKHKYFINNNNISTELTETVCEKDLGVNVDQLLSFEDHVFITIKKARSMSGLLIRTMDFKCPSVLVPLYISKVRPLLEYGNVVWCPYKKKDIKVIEKVQQHFTKYITGMYKLSYSERLFRLKLPSLEYRRIRGDFIETYKILHNLYDSKTTQTLLTLDKNSLTRSHNFKLTKFRVNHKPYQMFYTNRIVNRWNGLPMHIVNADSLNSFKNKIDNHFKHIMFKTDIEI